MTRLKIFLLGSAISVVTSGGAWAQSTQSDTVVSQSQAPTSDRAKIDNSTQVQEVVVTGSRIARPNLNQPTPISTLSPEQIQDAGTANLGDIIAQLPSVGTFSTVRGNSNNFGNGAGISEVDLRNLGVNRTLVLVDGQRHVNGDLGSQGVDINSIPTSLVDHVEIVTGGASAIYGSDAVSGVVNIILKHNFEGLEVEAQGGDFDAGFGTKYSAYATAGHNFDVLGGRMNVTLSGFYNNEAAISDDELPYEHNNGTIVNPRDLSGPVDPTFFSSPAAIIGDGTPDRLHVQNIGSDILTRPGVLINPLTGGILTAFDSAGQPVNQPARTGYDNSTFGQLAGCQTCYFGDTQTQVSTPIETRGGELIAHYDVTPHFHAFVDGKFVDTAVRNVIESDYTFEQYGIAPDNAFISPATAAVLAPYFAAAPAAAAANGVPTSALNPLLNEFIDPDREQDIERRTYRIVAGLSGDFDARIANVKWDGALNYGETNSHLDISGIQITNNFAAALDSVVDPATGQPVCRVATPSATNGSACVPFNPFGGNNSAAAYNYSFGRFLTRDHLSQEVANLNTSADTSRFFNLQGGPVALAVGGEYRMERAYEKNDSALSRGLTDELISDSAGGFNVYEGYVEGNVPIFKHFAPGLEELSIDGAFREAHYSTSGDVGAYKATVLYKPVDWLTLRGTYSRAVRAPNITEAFSPTSAGYFNVTDPCSIENISTNVNYAKNCAAGGVPSGFAANQSASIIGQSSGNPNLAPEKSLSYTGGIVFEPPIIPHLSVTIDYYSILIKDAITEIDSQDIINNCYNNSTGLSQQYCSLFTRGADGNINFVKTTFVNASELYTNGLELQVAYSVGVAPLTQRFRYTSFLDGRLGLSADVNYVMRLRNFPFQNNPGQYNVEEGAITGSLEGDVPALRALTNVTYHQGPVQFDWQVRFVGHAARFDRDPTQADFSEAEDLPYAGAKFFHDITLRYDLPGPAKGFQAFIGVNDLFGETPPYGLVVGAGTDAAYDLGRYIYGGIKFRR